MTPKRWPDRCGTNRCACSARRSAQGWPWIKLPSTTWQPNGLLMAGEFPVLLHTGELVLRLGDNLAFERPSIPDCCKRPPLRSGRDGQRVPTVLRFAPAAMGNVFLLSSASLRTRCATSFLLLVGYIPP